MPILTVEEKKAHDEVSGIAPYSIASAKALIGLVEGQKVVVDSTKGIFIYNYVNTVPATPSDDSVASIAVTAGGFLVNTSSQVPSLTTTELSALKALGGNEGQMYYDSVLGTIVSITSNASVQKMIGSSANLTTGKVLKGAGGGTVAVDSANADDLVTSSTNLTNGKVLEGDGSKRATPTDIDTDELFVNNNGNSIDSDQFAICGGTGSNATLEGNSDYTLDTVVYMTGNHSTGQVLGYVGGTSDDREISSVGYLAGDVVLADPPTSSREPGVILGIKSDASGNVELDTMDSGEYVLTSDQSSSVSLRMYGDSLSSVSGWEWVASSSDNLLIYELSGSGSVGRIQLNSGASSWTAFSDKNLKTKIKSATVLHKLNKHLLKRYNYKSDIGTKHEKKRRIGVIAQDLIKIFPEVVYGEGTDDKPYTVDYATLSSIALQGVLELKERVELLEEKLLEKGVL